MKSLILAVNIGKEDFSSSSIVDILMVSLEKARFNDLVLFLPRMGSRTEEFLLGLAKCCDLLGTSFCTDVFIEEEDRESISFDFLASLKRENPNFNVHSKEDEVSIGDQVFSYFSLDMYSSDELDYFLEGIYDKSQSFNSKRNFAISSDKDKKFLNSISPNFKFIPKDEIQVFARHCKRKSELVRNINNIYDNGDYYNIPEEKAKTYSTIDNESNPVLKKVPVSTYKNGKK